MQVLGVVNEVVAGDQLVLFLPGEGLWIGFRVGAAEVKKLTKIVKAFLNKKTF
jgi:Na+/alanine symporter